MLWIISGLLLVLGRLVGGFTGSARRPVRIPVRRDDGRRARSFDPR